MHEVLLYTHDLQAAKQEVESLGGHIVHQFTDVVFVASLPDLVDPSQLTQSSVTAPPTLDATSTMAADAWVDTGSQAGLVARDPKEGLSWDAPGHKPPRAMTRVPPRTMTRIPQTFSEGAIQSTGTPTSLYMSGSIAVGAVIVSGPGAVVSFASRTPVTALARREDHIDLFAVGTDISSATAGRTQVYTTWWDGAWHNWGTVGNQTFPSNTPVTAIARRADHIDLFAVGADGRVYTTWWDGTWHDWGTVGTQTFPSNTPIAAIARREDHIDLFAVGRDRGGSTTVYTTWWDGTWHAWQEVNNSTPDVPLLTPITAIARREDHIDLFAVGRDQLIHTTWWDGTWHDWGTVGTQTFPLNTPVAALARQEDHIDLFAVGPGQLVHTTWWDGTWHDWGTVGNQTFPPNTPVAAIARKPDHIDLFAVGIFIPPPPGSTTTTVYTAWWDGEWHEWGRVNDTNDAFPLRTPLAAIARHAEQIDLFGVQFNDEKDMRGGTHDVFSVYSTWWSGEWHDWAPIGGHLTFTEAERREIVGEVQQGLSFLANAEPTANVSFVYDFHFVDVSAAPGDISDTESAEAPWRNAALQQMGFDPSRQGSVDYVQHLRQTKGTDWAYVGYFTKYQLHHFAYAGDERICMEYANDGWGSDVINRVFAHETCHIFGAADEYQASECGCGERHGHLSVPNQNCVNCAGPHEICLMDRNDLQLCRWSQGQIGWGDPLLGFAPNTPVTSIARMPEHIDVFAVGADGAVYTTFWDGDWHKWGQVGQSSGLFPPHAPVAAIARRADHIDLFAVGTDGRVYTTWWDGDWHNWGTVGTQTFPSPTPIAAIARRADHIDLFAVGDDGAFGTAVYTAWWDGTWHGWRKVHDTHNNFSLLTPVSAIARREDHIDLFAVGSDGLVYTTWWDGAWHAWGTVGEHVVAPLTPVAAIARRADHIDLFAIGSDGLMHTTWWDGDWHAWGTVGNAHFTQRTPISAIARRADHIDLFAVGQNGLVFTNWWSGSWHDWGTVDTDGFTQLTPVAAISRKSDHIDLFAVAPDGAVYTNWWGGSWHVWAPISNRAPTFKLTTTQLPAIEGTHGQIPTVSALLLGNDAIYATHYTTPGFFQPAVQPGELVALDRLTFTPIKRVTVGKSPRAIALHQATNHLYVVNYQDVSVSVIDAAQFTLVDTLTFPGFGMIATAVSQKYHRVFVTQPGQKRIIVIDAQTRAQAEPMSDLAVTGEVVVDEATDRLYTLVKHATDETLQELVEFEISAQGQTEVRRITLDGQVSRHSVMAVDANRLYVINKDPQLSGLVNHQQLTVLDRTTLTVIGKIPLHSRSGMGVATSLVHNVVYVTTQYHIHVIDAPTFAVLRTIPHTAYQSDPFQPQGAVTVDEPTGVAYFGGAGSSTLVRHVYLPS